jgi:2-oxoglutarate dehydrogenase complex dehydrogenase (E1) component-like enzyme
LANSDGKIPYKKLSTDKSKPLTMDSDEFWEDIQSANFSFIFPTKPSNMFHALRRQMKRDFRKPLVIAGPKGLLRHNKCISKLE